MEVKLLRYKLLEVLKNSGIPVPEIKVYRCCDEIRSLSFIDPITGKDHYFNPIPPVEELMQLYQDILKNLFKPDIVIREGELKRHLLLHEEWFDGVTGAGEEWIEVVCARWERGKLSIYFIEEHIDYTDVEEFREEDLKDIDEIIQSCPSSSGQLVLETEVAPDEQPIKLKFSKLPLSLPIFEPLGNFKNEKGEKIYVYKFSCP